MKNLFSKNKEHITHYVREGLQRYPTATALLNAAAQTATKSGQSSVSIDHRVTFADTAQDEQLDEFEQYR